METIKLLSGFEIPVLGLGTARLRGGLCREVVKVAVALGYRHIDTATVYLNHKKVGEGLKKAGIDREEMFITSKVRAPSLRYNDVLKACEKALEQLQTRYIDLYLIHWPNDSIPLEETFKAFKKLVDNGRVRSIGISNFDILRVEKALKASEIPISINQIKYNPYSNKEELLEFCEKNKIVVTAYSPLAVGKVLNDPILKRIAEKHEKTVAQVSLRWGVQKGMVVIPKAKSVNRLEENMDIFGWELSEEEMREINNISH